VRNKREHCINATFHCVRDNCRYLQDLEARWPGSGLDRFHLFPGPTPALPELRTAGQDATICPYEITRTALAFQDVWIGDYNYVFAPRNRTLFSHQPGWDPARTWLIIDEAHNLAARVADAHSATLDGTVLRAVLAALNHQSASKPLIRAWETLTLLVAGVRACDALDLPTEEDLTAALDTVTETVATTPLDYAALGPELADALWQPTELAAWLGDHSLSRLLWSPTDGRVEFTCLDAAPVIGATLHEFDRVLLASATVGPAQAAADAWGLEELERVTALTPWRDSAYDVAVDVRVDTRYQHRDRHLPTTASTVAALAGATDAGVVVFFPSYRYAENAEASLLRDFPEIRVGLQPRLPDLAAQAEWVEQSLALADVLFLVLGSSFAEAIDMLGGRVSHAMVVGPALPEVNARQRAWQDELRRRGGDRETVFDRVYRQPGLQKVNQGLGRLVRAPGHRTRVLLHCQRFIDPAYARWLAPEYQLGVHIHNEVALEKWLTQPSGSCC
jgi:Rad3-related DNA helicase